ncbi:MAG: NUDIX domain-containing protein [Microthrixaceae bacterium]|nr:NUDIX domain-containing protein [Microthrixaceae bacterium]
MPKLSAGLLLYYPDPGDGGIRILLVHPGGPFWARKDDGSWSIPKGEYAQGDDPHEAALREFTEELGSAPPAPTASAPDFDLGQARLASGKTLHIWARRGTFDAQSATSNTFELEWPKGSGRLREFPEVDRAEWFSLEQAKLKLNRGQVTYVDRLLDALNSANG